MNRLFASVTLMVVVLALMISLASTVAAGQRGVLYFDDDARTWTDATGKYEVVAALVKYRNRQLTLETASGKSIVISIDRISKPDQAYAITRIRGARRQVTRPQNLLGAEQLVATEPPKIELDRPDVRVAPAVGAGDSARLYGVDWYPIDRAKQLAMDQGKPVMWFRVLGELDGFM